MENKHFTWKELAKQIEQMTDEQKNTDVTVFLGETEEFIAAVDNVYFSDDNNDILDLLHPYIKIPL